MPSSRHSDAYLRVLEELRKARLAADLTQTDVARRFGKHASFVSKIEMGERRIDVVELADFCRVYGVRLQAFLKKAGLE